MLTHKLLSIILLLASSITCTMDNEKENKQPVYLVPDNYQPTPALSAPNETHSHSITLPAITIPIPLPLHKLPKRIMWASGAIASVGIALHARTLFGDALKLAKEGPRESLIAACVPIVCGGAAGSALLCAKKTYRGPYAAIKKKKAAMGIGKVAGGTLIFTLSTFLNSCDDSMPTILLARGGQVGGLACIADGAYDIYKSIE